ncbi:NAD(P)H-dependent oxidoreductase [Marinomonas colpomeniae]|uniref:NAD(P)H-dependent oxidoreductase n=1 Tax=Marinomonas colpomeniae TaxID=2774408 RepID=A0ABR8NTX0_9GAMM|nr:NAD(P)H-dependent oxidoreductase [Marinomonas colpomeniae]MBD5769505.1 NAD(P)H-dependent oxidoreductase [Marinomonas colpomeniae]
MSHHIIADLEKRHTVKHYDAAKKVSKEDLTIIYEALRLSPSSINSQPWKFVVIESDAAKQRFEDTFANKFEFNKKHAKAASHIILFAHKTHYSRDDFSKIVDNSIKIGRVQPENREQAFGSFAFAEMNTDANGNTEAWTKAQTYIAFGNAMHVMARLNIGSTAMEGIDAELVGEIFKEELEGYQCDVALAIGYNEPESDYNAALPKYRHDLKDVLTVI